MDLPIIRLKDMRVYYFSLIIAMLGISTYFGLSQSFISFEKGIEIVRSRGYSINGEMEWDLAYSEDWKVAERSLRSFLDACDRIQSEHGSLTVYPISTQRCSSCSIPPRSCQGKCCTSAS